MARSGVENAILILEGLVKKLLRDLGELARRLAKLEDESGAARQPPGGGGGPSWIGQTTTTVAALYGSGGMVKLTTLQKALPADSDPKQTDLGVDPVKVYNGTGGVIPANKNCGGYFIGTYRVISWANCTSPTVADPTPVAAASASVAAMTTDTNTFVTDGTDQTVMTG